MRAGYLAEFETSLQFWQARLKTSVGEVARLEAALSVSYYLARLERHAEALATLDRHGPRHPPPQLMADWLNARAYELTALGRAGEALAHLDDAALLVDELTASGRSLAGCIAGTRGIALLHLGRLDEAEAQLLRALGMGQAATREEGRPGPIGRSERVLAGERWYWLAEIAARRGQDEEAHRRLMTAAGADGLHALLAHERLGLPPVKSVEYPWLTEKEWVAVDRRGRAAFFTSAGSGPIPRILLQDPSTLTGLATAIAGLPEITACELQTDAQSQGSCAAAARRGLFAFEWAAVEDGGAQYILQARPTVPARADQLDWPELVRPLLASLTSTALDFERVAVDVASAFECEGDGTGQRA
jgi:tetratricopeptide (TPR) repeat protein